MPANLKTLREYTNITPRAFKRILAIDEEARVDGDLSGDELAALINTSLTPKLVRARAKYWYEHTNDKQRSMVDTAPRGGLEALIGDLLTLLASTKRRMKNRKAEDEEQEEQEEEVEDAGARDQNPAGGGGGTASNGDEQGWRNRHRTDMAIATAIINELDADLMATKRAHEEEVRELKLVYEEEARELRRVHEEAVDVQPFPRVQVFKHFNLPASAAGLGVGSAAGVGSLPAAAGVAGGPSAAGSTEQADAESLREVVRAAIRETWLEMEAKQRRARKPQSFSSVGSQDVDTLIRSVKLVAVRGEAVAPQEAQVPEGTPECASFVRQEGCSEDAMTPALLQHHQQQLMKLGVVFDELGGFEMYDTHSKGKLLQFRCDEKSFSGGFAGCVAPFGLTEYSLVHQLRIIYEHKLNIKARHKRQAVVELLGAYACSPCPVLLDLTDGQKHIVYTIRNRRLFVWENLTPTQAYYLQAQHLRAAGSLRAGLDLQLHQLPEEEQQTMHHVQQVLSPAFGGEAALQEQLDSVLPFMPPEERESVELELVSSWARAADFSQPPEEAQNPAPSCP